MHAAVGLEVVVAAVDGAVPLDAAAVVAEEVLLAVDGLPAGERPAVLAEVGPAPVGVPLQPACVHHAFAVEVVVIAVDGAAPFNGIAVLVEVIGLAFPSSPVVGSIFSVRLNEAIEVSLFDKTGALEFQLIRTAFILNNKFRLRLRMAFALNGKFRLIAVALGPNSRHLA